MADNLDGKSNNLLLGVLLGAAVLPWASFPISTTSGGTNRFMKIDVPGFSGEILRSARTSLSALTSRMARRLGGDLTPRPVRI
jgi:hypothetical protein